MSSGPRPAGAKVSDLEQQWSALVEEADFAQMCQTMQRLLDALNPGDSRR